MIILFVWLSIMIVACCVIAAVLARHASAIAALDVSTIPRAQEKRTKEELVALRILRRGQQHVGKLLHHVSPLVAFWMRVQQQFRTWSNNIADQYRTLEWKRSFEQWRQKSHHERRAYILRTLQEADDARHAGVWDAAEKKYVDVITVDPKNVAAYVALAKNYFASERYVEVIETCEHVVRVLMDSNVMAWAFLGRALKAQGQYAEALHAFERALAFDDTLAKRWVDVGDCYREIGGRAEAIGAYKKAAQIEPNNPWVLDHLLEISIISGDKRQAREALLQLQSSNPENQKLGEWEERIRSM